MQARRHEVNVYVFSAIIGAAAGGLALLLCSLLMWLLQLPVAAGSALSLLSFGAGCLAAGITAGKLRRQGGISSGVKTALIMLVLLTLVTLVRSWFGYGGGVTGEFLLGRLTAAVICGTVGGILGVNKR